ncbi:hypothetical protein I4U23_018441 [Adineta vaga]|nr:hypothetical protein I4U23_018441 [Adineta vaga]
MSILKTAHGTHSVIEIESAGFKYIDATDIVRCDVCHLEISNWPSDMKPFAIHSKQSPTCPFVLSMLPTPIDIKDDVTHLLRMTSLKSHCTDITPFVETDIVKQVRKRTFSHWPHSSTSSPSFSQMIQAGFFSCNVEDRVICIYCNIICQEWSLFTDDPFQLHKMLSPNCPYVRAMLNSSSISSLLILNNHSTASQSLLSENNYLYRCDAIVHLTAINPLYMEIPQRYSSFLTWPYENLPSVDDLVKSGFFYTGTKTIVTCFYCNGSLQNWSANDKPLIEHVYWFPQCAYAKQLCGSEMYEKVQQLKRAKQQGRKSSNLLNEHYMNKNDRSRRARLQIPDENTLSRLVAGRFDLPISVCLVKGGFKPTIVRRCWKDQLRIKRDDFVSDCDLFIACVILRKQIDCIGGKKENVVIAETAMKTIREVEQTEIHQRIHITSTSISASSDLSNENDTDKSTKSIITSLDSSQVVEENQSIHKKKMADGCEQNGQNMWSSTNHCVLCLEEERCLSCLPCGHLATCIPCGHSLRTCPICRNTINAFMRVYV